MEAAPPRLTRLVVLTVTLCAALCGLLARVGADSRWLAAMGGAVARAGRIPTGIPYATESAHWTNVPVLAELLFHALESVFGDRGLVLAQLVAVAIALLLLAVDMRASRVPDWACALALVAVVFAAAPALIVARSQLFSLALFPLLVLLVRNEARAPSRRIWLLVPLMALWSNLHGAVLVGLFVAGSYLVFERARREPLVSSAVAAAAIGALFATPALQKTAHYYVTVLGSEAAQRGEGMWAPLSLHALFDVVFIVVAIPLSALAVRSRPAFWEYIALAGLAAAAVHSNRNTVWFTFFVAGLAGRGLGRAGMRDAVVKGRTFALCSSAAAAVLVLGIAHPAAQAGASARLIRATESLAQGRPVLADELDAERLALSGQRVWIANPLDAFPRADQRAYLDWLEGKADGRVFDASVILVTRTSGAHVRLAGDHTFRVAASDRYAVLYVRKPSG